MTTPQTLGAPSATTEIDLLKRRLERERAIRREAEAIAEKGLRDLYQRQRQLELLEIIAAAANQSISVNAVLEFAVEQFCIFGNWTFGHAYLVNDGVLCSADIWHVSDPTMTARFQSATAAAHFTRGIGLPGTALATAQPVWIAELIRNPNFPRLRLAEDCGLQCGAAFPILSRSEVVGVLEFYAPEIRPANDVLIELMLNAGMQLGRAIERQAAQARLENQTIALARARDKATEADRAKSAFLASISHELRTPLNAIIGFSDMMIQRIHGALPDTYADYAKDIHNSGTHLKKIVNDILDISKIEAGAMELCPRSLSLAEAGEACRCIVAPLASKGEVELNFAISDGLPLFELDETRFHQILINLISNAVKFTPAGGRVEVRAWMDAAGCIISVADTGIGMTPEGIALAVQPFRQVDGTLSRRFEGTGLGLPLAKALIELHGGQLSINSKPGNGTTVELHLPKTLAAQAA